MRLLTLADICLQDINRTILRDINLSFNASSIHSVVGIHGSGKSSLAQIISGNIKPTSGWILLNSKKYYCLSTIEARRLGIEYIPQSPAAFDNLKIYEVFFLVKLNYQFLSRRVSLKQQIQLVGTFLAEHGVDINPSSLIRDLSSSDKLNIHILKALFWKPKIIVLDEVFERLTPSLHNSVRLLLRRARSEGTSIIILTHSIDEILDFSDTVTILKDGQIILSEQAGNIDKMSLVHLTYTQMTREDTAALHNEEFTTLLKYNEAITNSIPYGLIVVDERLKVKFINENARSFFFVNKVDYFNTELPSLLGERNKHLAGIVAANFRKNEESKLYNIPAYSKNKKRQTNLTIHPMRDGWNTIGFFVIIEDVTEQERLRSRIALSDKLSSIGILAAGVAHEINNPLAIMLNYVQSIKLLSQNKKLAPKVILLEEQINYIKNIVANLITLSDGRLSPEEFDVNELILNTINFIRFYSKNQNVMISFKQSYPEFKISANKNEIKQVLLNLFKNSFEAMPGGGEIHIETEKVEMKNHPYVQISFRDTGTGIKHENLKDIFSPFYSTKGADGTHLGLGLSISYAIINKYKGEIILDTANKQGCCFQILLPCTAG